MNYELELGKSNPAYFAGLNGAVAPLVAGSGSATLSTGSTTYTFHGWISGRENVPFSLEVWYLPVTFTGTGEVVVIGHATEGLLYNGQEFILRLNLSGGVVESRWTPLETKSSYYALVYDGGTMTLYVDGVSVAAVDVPDDNSFVNTDTNILTNALIGITSSGIYDSLAFYYRPLSLAEIELHFSWGRDAWRATDIAMAKGAGTYSFTLSDVDTVATITFDTSNWTEWYTEDIISFDPLQAEDAGGVWMGAVPLEPYMTTSSGIYVSWVGNGATVSYSIDDTNWTPLTNRSLFFEDQTATDVIMSFRIELEDGYSWMERLSLTLLNSRTMQPLSGQRQIIFKSAAMDETPGHQLEYHADAGATLSNGYLEIQPQTVTDDEPVATIRTIELWAKIQDNAGFIFRESASNYVRVDNPGNFVVGGVTLYRNGAAASGAVPQGQWNHYVIVLPTGVNTPLRFGNNLAADNPLNINIAHLATYSQAFTAADALALYRQSTGAPAIQVIDSGSMDIAESAEPVDIYAYTWSTVFSS